AAEAFRVAGVIAGAGDPLPSRREFYVALWGRVGPEYRGSWMARAARRAGPAEMRALPGALAAARLVWGAVLGGVGGAPAGDGRLGTLGRLIGLWRAQPGPSGTAGPVTAP